MFEITKEELLEAAVNRLMRHLEDTEGLDYTEHGEFAFNLLDRVESDLNKSRKEMIAKGIEAAVVKLSADNFDAQIAEWIESAKFPITNSYGEAKATMTVREFIDHRLSTFLTEDVDRNGESKTECRDAYNWQRFGKRIPVAIVRRIRRHIDSGVQTALAAFQKTLSGDIATMVRDAVMERLTKAKVTS